MSTTSLRNRIAAAALTAGAIAIGAMAVGTATAHAETFQQSCEQHPEGYADGAVRGVYSAQRRGNDRYEYCSVYDANGKKLGVAGAYPQYGYYTGGPVADPFATQPVKK
jgi:hypothetical protein